MDVTDVLRDRMREPAGLEHMAIVSVLLHGALIASLLFTPYDWLMHNGQAPPTLMTITLGGDGSEPASGGLTAIGGRPVQVQTPPQEAPRREALRPPAAKTPEMTLPRPGAKPVRATPAPVVRDAPEAARGRTPTRGAQLRSGTAVAETGTRGQGFGLSSAGGVGSGSTLDVADFCCPDYLVLMTERIRTSWNPQAEVPGNTIVRFTILRDGRLTDVVLEKSSGYVALDLTAQRAVQMTKQLPPLPVDFTNPTLTVHLNFRYQ